MRYFMLLLVSSVAVTNVAAAQSEQGVTIFAGGGIAVPNAPDAFRDGWKEGFDIVVGVGFPLASKLTLQGTVAYERFSFDHAASGLSPDVAGGEAEILSFSGEVRFRFVDDSDRFSPYLLGGAGVARVSTKDLTLSLSPTDDLFTDPAIFDPRFFGLELEGFTETNAMTTFGGGVNIPFTESTQFFLEVRYQISFTSDDISSLLLSPLAFTENTAHWTMRGGLRFAL